MTFDHFNLNKGSDLL